MYELEVSIYIQNICRTSYTWKILYLEEISDQKIRIEYQTKSNLSSIYDWRERESTSCDSISQIAVCSQNLALFSLQKISRFLVTSNLWLHA